MTGDLPQEDLDYSEPFEVDIIADALREHGYPQRAAVGPVDVAEGDAVERHPGVMRRRLKLPRGLLQNQAPLPAPWLVIAGPPCRVSSRRPGGHNPADRRARPRGLGRALRGKKPSTW